MIFNGLFSSLKVSSLFCSWFCPDFVLSQVPLGYHPRLQWCALLLWAALASLLPGLGMGEVLLALLLDLDGVGVCWRKPAWFRLKNEPFECPAGHKPGPKFFISCLTGGC